MKINIIYVVLILQFLSCIESVKKESTSPVVKEVQALAVPEIIIDKSELHYDRNISVWTLNGEQFSGYAVSYYPNSNLQQKIGILEGKKQNETKDWYPNGKLKFSANYHQGKLHGEKKSWSADSTHQLLAHYNYYLGKAHGVQKKWYLTGETFKILHLNMGKEEGIQQAYRKNGELYVNYEARNGRIFGLKRASLCFELENEKIQYAKSK